MSIRYVSILIFVISILLSLLSCHGIDTGYKWVSTVPVHYVPLSSIIDEDRLNYYLNSEDIVVFYIDDEYDVKRNGWILYKLNITKVTPERIPDYGDYVFVDLGNSIVLYPEDFITSFTTKYVLRNSKGMLIYYPPKPMNNTQYIVKPPMNSSEGTEFREVYGYTVDRIPEYHNYTLVTTEDVFIIYPKRYIVRTEDGALIYNPPVDVEDLPVYNISIKVLDTGRGIFEIKPKKILITHNIDPDSKEIMDFIGHYVSENNGTFVYINKVPPRYRHTLITGVAVQRAVLDDSGDYIIKVAGRKLKVDWRDDELIYKKIRHIKALSKILNINITYVSTGVELLDVIEENDINIDELKELLDDYWFKKRFENTYFHTYVNSLDRGYYTRDLDILSMGYYPNVYVHKAPETFKNDPIGGFYPETVSYIGSVERGYWKKEVTSENEYYHYIKGEPTKEDPVTDRDDEGITLWYYQGNPVSLTVDSELNEDRYKHFNHWFVKNYGNALSKGVDGLLLPSDDRYLLDAVLGRDNGEIYWKLNMEDNVEYIVISGKGEPTVEKNITVLKVPGIFEDLYGVPQIKEFYIPPEDETPGVYIGDIVGYNYSILYRWKDNYTWICSFKDYSHWISNYMRSRISIKDNDSIYLHTTIPLKVTVYTKDVVYPKNVSVEEYSKELNKVVLYLPEGLYNVKFKS